VNGLTFTRGVLMALGFAFLSSVAFNVIGPGITFQTLVFLLVPILSFVYLLSIGKYRHRKSGWASCLVLWCVFTILLWALSAYLIDFVLLHAMALSALRSMFFHKNILSVLMDFALTVLAVCTSIWAVSYTGSIFLSVWCFFLVQAAFVAIPIWASLKSVNTKPSSNSQAFDVAHRKAEEALQKMSSK